jgi:uncharacterized membrane protein YczE
MLCVYIGKSVKTFIVRLIRLLAGLFLYALGTVITLQANIGYAPWQVLNSGISKTTGITIGFASIFVGFLIIIIVLLLGEKIGLGTVLNMALIGLFLDAILAINIIPLATQLLFSIPMLIAGLFIIAIGSYFYIKSAFGAGPRDSLMVAFTRKTRFPIGLCRSLLELLAVLGGWALGGMVGTGTVISVIAIGFCVQITFKAFRFDATAVKHETLNDTFKSLFVKKNC